MNTMRVCGKCGAPLPADAPKGFCPACMMQAALETNIESRKPESIGGGTIQLNPSTGAAGIGTKLRYFGDYELLEKIAQGGMGVVYKARQVSLNRAVAVKMILNGQLASEVEVQRFLTEAEAAANLQHPNIVAVHEVGQDGGQYYFSMDFVEGRNLADYAKVNPLPAAGAAQLVKTIAEAIHYAHQRGTLHRDLKPQNVLIDAASQPHITDFGLAKHVGRDSGLTQSGAVMGSPSYMPPEQAAGKNDLVGPSSDVYSIGAMLYFLLAGRAPFAAETPVATLRKVMEEQPVAPSKIEARTPPDLETICLKCLERRPERRYHSARELAEELGRFLNHEPILARPASAWRKVWSWSQRNPWAVTGAAAMVILGLLGFAYGLWEQLAYLNWKQGGATRPLPWMYASNRAVALLLTGWLALIGATLICFLSLHDYKRRNSPIPSALLAASTMVGLILFGGGLSWERIMIRSLVWETSGAAFSNVGQWTRFSAGGLLAGLICWSGIHLSWQAFQYRQSIFIGTDLRRPTPFIEEFEMNYRAFISAAIAVDIIFWVACASIPTRYPGYRLINWNWGSAHARFIAADELWSAAFIASLTSNLPWLVVAFRFSTRAPRRFFGSSICFLLVIALTSFHLGEVPGLVVILAALGGGLVILQMARIQKRAPGPLPENPIPSVTEAMGVNTKNSVFGILIAIVSIFVLDKVMAVAGANGLPVPRIWEMHGDYVVLTWLSIFNLFLFRFLQTLRRRAPATACFLSTTALTVSVIAPALAGLLLPGRRLDAIIASCLAGYAAGFAVLKFSRVREKNS